MEIQILIVAILFFTVGLFLFNQTKRIVTRIGNKSEVPDYSKVVLLGAFIIFIIICVPWVYTSKIFSVFGESNEVGDTIGGITGPFINGLSAILVYLALKAQIDANTLVRDQFEVQQSESRFFELIKLHRDNVAEISIGEATGKKIFVTLIREFRLIHDRLRKISEEENVRLNKRQLMEISYLILFFGFGPNSSRQLKIALESYEDQNLFSLLELKFDNRDIKLSAQRERKLRYIPFEGHQSRLGHYFRHLYQTVDFIHKKEIERDKYNYVKALRAQLTTHEQALLYINSLSPAGSKWWSQNYIIDYKMVKNIPKGFFDAESEVDLEEEFPPNYFEYQED